VKIRNWEAFQGYEKRGPRWIKLHVALLNDPAWITLPLVARAVLPALWIAASHQGTAGELPDDPAVLSILCHCQESELRQALPHLSRARFIVCDESVAALATTVSGERETETERETEERTELSLSQSESVPRRLESELEERGEFVQAVWAALVEKRGSEWPQMSPAEWQTACDWFDQEVPLRVVLGALERLQGKPKTLTLLYLAPAVREAFAYYRKAIA
jgi:hypothetical protein